MRRDATGAVDWDFAGWFRVSANDRCPLEVPYFHRRAARYIEMFERHWGDVTLEFASQRPPSREELDTN
jgi:hypothetical protein